MKLGTLYLLWDEGTAEKMLMDVVEMSTEVRDESTLAEAYGNLGALRLMQGQFQEAKTWLGKALRIFLKNYDAANVAFCFSNLATVYIFTDHLRAAEYSANQALNTELALGLEAETGQEYLVLAQVKFSQEDYEAAEQLYLRGYEIAKRHGHKDKLASACTNLALMYRRLNRKKDATEKLNEARVLHRTLGDRRGLELTERLLGELKE